MMGQPHHLPGLSGANSSLSSRSQSPTTSSPGTPLLAPIPRLREEHTLRVTGKNSLVGGLSNPEVAESLIPALSHTSLPAETPEPLPPPGEDGGGGC
jgi:hypothetical protein